MNGTERFLSWVLRRCFWFFIRDGAWYVLGFAYLVEFILSLLWVVYCWVVAVVDEMARCNETVTSWGYWLSIRWDIDS